MCVSLLADNTSALSWFRYASRSHRPAVRALARFGMQLMLACPHPLKLSGKHLAGPLNKGADALSRPREFPTWASVIEHHSPLARCQPYRVPFELTVHDSYRHYCSRDRGSIRAGNDQTFDSRADHFERWLRGQQCPLERLASVSPDDAVALSDWLLCSFCQSG